MNFFAIVFALLLAVSSRAEEPITAQDRDHWSFKPPTLPEVPAVGDEKWVRHNIDCFVLAELEQQGLAPAPAADAVTWLRRVTLDLTGLPPTPAEVIDFLSAADRGDAAYTAVVDRLLKSPRHGERWAQHWLDVVRYADTHGFEVICRESLLNCSKLLAEFLQSEF